MKKILVIGANGFAGRRILDKLSSNGECEVVGCSLHPDIQPGEKHTFVRVDMNDYPAVEVLFDHVCPDVVINCSALSVPDYCEQHREEAYAINVAAVENLAHCCEQQGSRFIHLSTDFVFDGKSDRLYTEEDMPAPLNYYGLTKYQGEQAVARNCRNYAVARVVVVYGKALPGQHGNSRKRKTSEYGVQLREKQKAKYTYGVLEKQFRNLFEKAETAKGITGEILLQLLEGRLDNIVFRLGIAPTRAAARQLVGHKHITVDGEVVNIPSFAVKPGQVIGVRERSKSLEVIANSLAGFNHSKYPWLEWDDNSKVGKLLHVPERADIPENIKEHLIVELYSK